MLSRVVIKMSEPTPDGRGPLTASAEERAKAQRDSQELEHMFRTTYPESLEFHPGPSSTLAADKFLTILHTPPSSFRYPDDKLPIASNKAD